jgi:cyclin-dependent kinase 7
LYNLFVNIHYGIHKDLDQLGRIFNVTGSPNEENWPGVTALPDYIAFEPCQPQMLSSILVGASPASVAFIARMIVLDPRKRATTSQLLSASSSSYWTESPTAVPHTQLLPSLLLAERLESK